MTCPHTSVMVEIADAGTVVECGPGPRPCDLIDEAESVRQSASAWKVREILKRIEADGWYLDRTRGSHRQFSHAKKRGLITVAGKPGDDLAPGTQNSILKQAGLK